MVINIIKPAIPAALIILRPLLTSLSTDLSGRNSLIAEIIPGKIRISKNIGPINIRLVIKRMENKISHETGLHTPRISMPVVAEYMLSEKDHMIDNATQPMIGGNILSK